MIWRFIQRRRANPAVIAVAGTLLFFLITLQLRRYVPPLTSTEYFTLPRGGSEKLIDDVYNTTLGFEKVFVISLPTRTDHRDAITLASALTDIEIEFIDGVNGSTVLDKVLPPGGGREALKDGEIGCWRAHMNVLSEIILRNISSALLLEDDADWDVRIKSQFHDFALSTQALTQPLRSNPKTYADFTFPVAYNSSKFPPNRGADILFDSLPDTIPAQHSPYGDDWDMLWVGHCGMTMPTTNWPEAVHTPLGRVVNSPDPTVPAHQHLRNIFSNDADSNLMSAYPPHTRVTHHNSEGVCSLGYAVSQQGARRMLHAMALSPISVPYDVLLREFCEGRDPLGKEPHICLTTQPSLFNVHWPMGPPEAMSDISDHSDWGYRKEAVTDVVRWSTRLNFKALLEGTGQFVDQWPDEKGA